MRKTIYSVSLSILVAALLLFSASWSLASDDLSSFAGQKGTLRIAGGTAHIPVMKEAAKQIINFNPQIQISIAGGGSGLGIKQAGEGLVDIGNAGRKPSDDEIHNYNLQLVKWAVDGVGAVVHPKNKAQSLTNTQLQDIYSGKISNWKDVGGVDREINLYTRDEASGTREVFWKKALAKGDISAKANVVVSNGAMKTAVAGDPFAIGFVSVGNMDSSVAPVALDGVAPSPESVRSGEYKVARGLYSLTKGEPSGLAKLFLEFIVSPTGQQIVVDKGFIPVQ
ncbi:phosphate ABC transporter substrate-binding protein, PhoT family [Desulfocapsa sulfexigens DSM 10523]|uniref:Phosphate ABC transporter substrate-binding protein, PhoT family n=1 Tax=Desulfocapsa sulfexigens (strain DSM 10523 / SB164P1) TaxID=1167006 RepID=M1P3R2_DESSD|nr:phosphate ABC transporter substrate-binding protein [Desulfocapsa sulfexigens]AGF78113.1 phosphate ABC transporter substrate-binding protein, PhoT family [Desulfocapsa sulfexigens DSM 10523]